MLKDIPFFPFEAIQNYIRTAALSFVCVSAFVWAANAQFVDATRVSTGLMTHDEWTTQVLSSPTGKEIISAGVDGRVVIWDAATGKANRELTLPAIVLTLSLSKDGLTLAAGDASGHISLI
ncbi:MAG: WD40 repeat domain-containing protein, partial [Acidobacteriota bacterium]